MAFIDYVPESSIRNPVFSARGEGVAGRDASGLPERAPPTESPVAAQDECRPLQRAACQGRTIL